MRSMQLSEKAMKRQTSTRLTIMMRAAKAMDFIPMDANSPVDT